MGLPSSSWGRRGLSLIISKQSRRPTPSNAHSLRKRGRHPASSIQETGPRCGDRGLWTEDWGLRTQDRRLRTRDPRSKQRRQLIFNFNLVDFFTHKTLPSSTSSSSSASGKVGGRRSGVAGVGGAAWVLGPRRRSWVFHLASPSYMPSLRLCPPECFFRKANRERVLWLEIPPTHTHSHRRG